MKYAGGELSAAQMKAGLRVMRGEFSARSVMDALKKVGVIYILPAANKLIAIELKAGRILRIDRNRYNAA